MILSEHSEWPILSYESRNQIPETDRLRGLRGKTHTHTYIYIYMYLNTYQQRSSCTQAISGSDSDRGWWPTQNRQAMLRYFPSEICCERLGTRSGTSKAMIRISNRFWSKTVHGHTWKDWMSWWRLTLIGVRLGWSRTWVKLAII